MIIDFRVRPPAKGFEKLSILGERKGFQLPPFDYEDTQPVPSAVEHSMPLFMQEMAEAGIGRGVILPRNTSIGWGGVSNDESAAAAAEYPDQLLAFGSVDVSGGIRAAVLEVERAVRQLGCRGIVVEPGCCVPPVYPDAPQMYPIYDRCAELGVPVVVSQSMLLGPDLSYAMPHHIQHIAKDFPTVPFIIAHASYPWVLQAAAVSCVTPNIWLIPDLYMHIRQVPGHADFAQAVYFAKGERILFGSAYPVRGLKQSVDELKAFDFPAALFAKITYDNAARLLGL